MRELTADEGGLAPHFDRCEDLFLDASTAAEAAGLSLRDDIFLSTNADRVERAIATNAANELLLKFNQAGTLSRAADALHATREAAWSVTNSARSGETEDRWPADAGIGRAGAGFPVRDHTLEQQLVSHRVLGAEGDELADPAFGLGPRVMAGAKLGRHGVRSWSSAFVIPGDFRLDPMIRPAPPQGAIERSGPGRPGIRPEWWLSS